jgi:hypothetical protein
VSTRQGDARTEQVNIRVTPGQNDVLAALVFLEECSASEVLRPVVERFLAQKANDPQVQLALRALHERRGIKSGTVASLRHKEQS